MSELSRSKFNKIVLVVLCLDLFGGRWITYVGIPGTPIYFLDSAFLLLCSYALLICKLHKDHCRRSTNVNRYILLILFTFLLFQGLRNGSTNLALRFRDLMPFTYLFFVPFLNCNLKSVDKKSLADKLIFVGFAHLSWAIPSARGLISPVYLGGIFQEPLFGVRTDQTGFVISIALLACFYRIGQSIKLKQSIITAVCLSISVVFFNSRASLIAVAFSLLFGLIYLFKSNSLTLRHRISPIVSLGFIFLALILFLNVFQIDLPEDSSLKRVGLIYSSTGEGQNSAYWTRKGRENAQSLLIEWTKKNHMVWFGAGPGREMLLESGAVRYLSGDLTVRSPHSWPISLLARFGIIGAGLWVGVFLKFFTQNDMFHRGLKILAFPRSAVYPIIITSLFGVIVESPFGMLPLVVFLALPKNSQESVNAVVKKVM